jgi:hypothetical protein
LRVYNQTTSRATTDVPTFSGAYQTSILLSSVVGELPVFRSDASGENFEAKKIAKEAAPVDQIDEIGQKTF